MNAMKLNFMRFGAIIAGVVLLSLQVKAQNETTTETTVRTQTETESTSIDTDRDAPRPRARAGIKAGLNASNLITDEVNDKNARYGFHAGVYGQLFVNEGFAIQPELNYSTKGNKVITNFGIIDQETKLNLNYLDIHHFIAIPS